jgi:hypothetical protein
MTSILDGKTGLPYLEGSNNISKQKNVTFYLILKSFGKGTSNTHQIQVPSIWYQAATNELNKQPMTHFESLG